MTLSEIKERIAYLHKKTAQLYRIVVVWLISLLISLWLLGHFELLTPK